MPSWIVHLATANEVMKSIKVENKNSFLVGNLIADAQRHVVSDFSIYVPYEISHHASIQEIGSGKEKLPNIQEFIKKYKNDLKNPMVLGYLTHLLTDYYWNLTTYQRYTIRDENGNFIGLKLSDGSKLLCQKEERIKLKHKDFGIFKNYMIKNKSYEIPRYEDRLLNDLKPIDEIPFNKEDINKIIKYIENESYMDIPYDYTLFTKDQIMRDYKNCINFVIESLEKYIKLG